MISEDKVIRIRNEDYVRLDYLRRAMFPFPVSYADMIKVATQELNKVYEYAKKQKENQK